MAVLGSGASAVLATLCNVRCGGSRLYSYHSTLSSDTSLCVSTTLTNKQPVRLIDRWLQAAIKVLTGGYKQFILLCDSLQRDLRNNINIHHINQH